MKHTHNTNLYDFCDNYMKTNPYVGLHAPINGSSFPSVENLQICLIPPHKMFDKGVYEILPTIKFLVKEWRGLISLSDGNSSDVDSCDVDQSKRKLFVHSSFCINLSNTKAYHVNALKNQIKMADEIGANGIVVHCGKYLKDNPETAAERFIQNVDKAMEGVSERCPLIIETCAGEGTELFVKREEFQEMIIKLRRKYGNRIGCCIDTAHVWGAGYDPVEFINGLNQEARNTIKLIHWNNSKVKKGSRIDRHAPLSKGLIDPKQLIKVSEWAKGVKIPIVIEW